MKKLALLLLAAASLVGTAGAASAQYGGYYYRGADPYYRHQYRERWGRRSHRRTGRIRQALYYPVGPGGRCPRHYTVQDGLCKPYRGY
jgi:hypothetical protein